LRPGRRARPKRNVNPMRESIETVAGGEPDDCGLNTARKPYYKEDYTMGNIHIEDLDQEISLTEDDLKHVQGGIALLLPAVQKVREAAARGGDHKEWIDILSTSY